jgi:hypothetical protein
VRRLLGSIVGAVVPEPQRSAIERRFGGDPALASLGLGLAEFFVGTKWLYENGMRMLHAMADEIATAYVAEANRRTVGADETLGFTWGGAMLWLFWLLRPTTWLLISIPLVGLLRLASFLTVRRPVAEPIVWALTRLLTYGFDRAALAKERAEFGGAGEADEIEEDADGLLFVYSARKREAWIEAATVEVGERLYRPRLLEPVERAGRRRYRYVLVPAGEHDVIRRFVRYQLPKTGIRWAKPRAVEPPRDEAAAQRAET